MALCTAAGLEVQILLLELNQPIHITFFKILSLAMIFFSISIYASCMLATMPKESSQDIYPLESVF